MIRTNTNCNNVLLVDETIANTYTVSINLSEIFWRMPQYKFSLTYEVGINKELSSSIEYEMYYRHRMYIEKSSVTGNSLGTYLLHIINHIMSLLDFKTIGTIKSLLIMDNLIFVILKMFKFISIITYIIQITD